MVLHLCLNSIGLEIISCKSFVCQRANKISVFLLFDSEFQDIFDVDHFITSLRDEVRILKELPPRLKKRVELGRVPSMPPISWSDISYYLYQVSLPLSL